MKKISVLLAVFFSLLFAGSAMAYDFESKVESCLTYVDKDDKDIQNADIQNYKRCLQNVLNDMESVVLSAPGTGAVCMRPVVSGIKNGLMGCVRNLRVGISGSEAFAMVACIEAQTNSFAKGKKKCGIN
jgi:hypothetical protein